MATRLLGKPWFNSPLQRNPCFTPKGLEAPRNSLELQLETSKSYSVVGDARYSYPVEEETPGKNSYPTEANMKKLINEEISKESNADNNLLVEKVVDK